MARLSKGVWENKALTMNTKTRVYHACVLRTLLYSSECWTTYMRQERRLNIFHMQCLKHILGIKWQDRITHQEILERAKTQSMHSLLSQRCLRWVGHICRMDDGRLPKDVLYGELSKGKRKMGRPSLHFRDKLKRDLKACAIPTESWETSATDKRWMVSYCTKGLRDSGPEERTGSRREENREEKPSCQPITVHV